jgi:hypothetical protein
MRYGPAGTLRETMPIRTGQGNGGIRPGKEDTWQSNRKAALA